MSPETGSIDELYRLFEKDEYFDISRRGTPLAAAIAGGVDLAAWTLTFEDDFDDVAATIGTNLERKPWKAPGPYRQVGAGRHAFPGSLPGGIYTQHGRSQLGLSVRKEAGKAIWSANISTATPSEISFEQSPNISFAQQYFYLEMRARMPDPHLGGPANAILWPGIWAYSVDSLGGPLGDLTRNHIEIDFLELYLRHGGDTTNVQWHGTMHHHEPKKLIAPGAWGRDVNASKIHGLNANALMGTPEGFRFWSDFNSFGGLVTPEEVIWFFNRREMCRGPMTPRMHQKLYFMISHQLSLELEGGMREGVSYPMVVDNFRVWQNPDWQAVSGPILDRGPVKARGTAHAAHFETGRPMRAYDDGRVFVLEFRHGLAAGATLAANGLEPRPIHRYARYDTIPPSGPLTALRDGDVSEGGWHALRYDRELARGAGGWRLLNAGWSLRAPAQWSPRLAEPARIRIDRRQIEAGLAEKHGFSPAVFPDGHPGRKPRIDKSSIAPRLTPNLRFVVSPGTREGQAIGRLTPENTPTRPVRYSASGSSNFKIDPASGQISMAKDAQLSPGIETIEVGAWPLPPMPMPTGSNICRVEIEVQPDLPFDLSYFTQQPAQSLLVWIEPSDAAMLVVEGGLVAIIRDKSNPKQSYVPSDADPSRRVAFGATAFKGDRPGLRVSADAQRYARKPPAPPTLPAAVVANLATRSEGRMSINLHGKTRMSAPFDYLVPHMGMFIWSAGSLSCFVNDVEIGMSPDAGTDRIATEGFAFWVMDGNGAGGNNVGRVYDAAGGLFNNDTNSAALNATLARLAIGLSPVDGTLRRKMFGEAAHRFDLADLLASDHPYRNSAPRMYA
jgi:hypothetical protein